jgi:hypothetical protein
MLENPLLAITLKPVWSLGSSAMTQICRILQTWPVWKFDYAASRESYRFYLCKICKDIRILIPLLPQIPNRSITTHYRAEAMSSSSSDPSATVHLTTLLLDSHESQKSSFVLRKGVWSLDLTRRAEENSSFKELSSKIRLRFLADQWPLKVDEFSMKVLMPIMSLIWVFDLLGLTAFRLLED